MAHLRGSFPFLPGRSNLFDAIEFFRIAVFVYIGFPMHWVPGFSHDISDRRAKDALRTMHINLCQLPRGGWQWFKPE